MNTTNYLTDLHPDATAVTILADPTNYADVAMKVPVENDEITMVTVRSHYNSDAHPDHPAISVYFWKPF